MIRDPSSASPTANVVPPYGPSSIDRGLARFITRLAIESDSTRLLGRLASDVNRTRPSTSSPLLRFLPITRHSPSPVSAEKEISPLASEMLTISTSVYSSRSKRLNLDQDSPAVDESGSTIANMPPGLSFRSAIAAKADAKPAFPW